MAAVVGPARASTSAEVKMTGVLIGVAVVFAAFLLSGAAGKATPRRLYWQLPFTELEAAAQDFHAHLATTAELSSAPVSVPVSYPDRTAPGVTATMHQGWAVRPPGLPAPGIEAW